jgi:hypothetical protein
LLLILPACAALFAFLSLRFLKRSFASYLHAFAPFLACLCAMAYLPLRLSAPAFACILVFLPAFAPFRACHHCAFSCMPLRLYLPAFGPFLVCGAFSLFVPAFAPFLARLCALFLFWLSLRLFLPAYAPILVYLWASYSCLPLPLLL